MTEAQWRACRDPRAMLDALLATALGELRGEPVAGPRASFAVSGEKQRQVEAGIRTGQPPRGHPPEDRKFLLWVAACCRRVEHLLVPEKRRALLDLHERDADGALHPKELAAARRRREAALRLPLPSGDLRPAHRATAEVVSWLLLGGHDTNHEAVLDAIAQAVLLDPGYADPEGEGPHQAALLRDVYGTPYAPPRFDAEWRTGTAVSLAKQMYEGRDFAAMPILADALQDAGCDSDEVLRHCRDANLVHVRGCWVVDAVLGKS